jgi:hypothetical protein
MAVTHSCKLLPLGGMPRTTTLAPVAVICPITSVRPSRQVSSTSALSSRSWAP